MGKPRSPQTNIRWKDPDDAGMVTRIAAAAEAHGRSPADWARDVLRQAVVDHEAAEVARLLAG